MSKKADNWLPLYVGDYLADTSHLTTEQHGAYLLILMALWKRAGAGLPDIDENLAAAARLPLARWKAIRPVLLDGVLLRTDGQRVEQKRMQAEIERAQGITEARAAAGAKGGATAQANRKQNGQANAEQTSTPSPSPIPSSPPSSEKAGADAPAARASPAAEVCLALKAAGIANVSPSNVRLRALVDAGAGPPEFVQFAAKAIEVAPANAFGYVIGAVEGERKRAAATVGALHRGPMPNRQEALELNNQAVADRWLASEGTGS